MGCPMKRPLWIIALLLSIGAFCMLLPKQRSFAERVNFSPKDRAVGLIPENRALIEDILAQNYTFLAKGTQAYVFVSADGSYVLKFLKLRPSNGKRLTAARAQKNEEALKACQLAWNALREQTALVYAHLGPTPEFQPVVHLTDRKGKRICLNLENACFLIQEKADLIIPTIQEKMAESDVPGAAAIIRSVCNLLKEMQERGVVDNDPVIRRNFGVIHGRAVQIDCGMMKLDPKSKEIDSVTAPLKSFKKWITSHYPELLPALEQTAELR